MRPLALLLVLLLAVPVSAQVITTGAPTAGSGGGSGNVTGTFTTGVIPMGTAAHVLSDSLNGTMPGTNGSLGFNTAHRVEVTSDGATFGAGLFGGGGSVLTVHAADNNPWQTIFYNDVDGLDSWVAIATGTTAASGGPDFILVYGDGAGGTQAAATQFSPTISFVQTNISTSTISVAPLALFVQQDASQAQSHIGIANAAGTVFALSGNFIFPDPSGKTGTASLEVINKDGTTYPSGADVSLTLLSGPLVGIASAAGELRFWASNVTTNTNPIYLNFISPGWNGVNGTPYDHGAVAFKAPAATTGNAQLVFTLPIANAAANGQPLVATTAGVLSFAAGTTGTRTVRASGGAADCTLIFTGGVLTGGTC